jgi:zinc/manganese transport system permease protein
MLVGQILWVGHMQVIVVAVLTGVVLAAWFGIGRERLGRVGFYLLFGLSVTASVQMVGVYLVFSSLIIPALASRNATRLRLAKAYAVGGLGYLLGLIASEPVRSADRGDHRLGDGDGGHLVFQP